MDTEGVMRLLADWVGIDFDPILLEPTFNGFPIRANSGYPVDRHGVIRDPLDRARELSADERDAVERRTAELFERVLETCG
jgi:hypothetical protein